MNEEEEETNSLRDLIQNLTANMESNFVSSSSSFQVTSPDALPPSYGRIVGAKATKQARFK